MPTIRGEKRDGGGSIRKTGNSVVVELEWQYLIEADTPTQTREEILFTPGLPIVYVSTYGPTVCVSLDATRNTANPILWDVTATFSSEVSEDSSGAQGGAQMGDPVAFRPIAKLAFETYTDVSLKDADGDAVVNSANQPFETGFSRVRTLVRFDFEQFERADITDEDIAERNETVNDATYKGKDAKTLKLTVRDATLGFYYGYRVWRIAYSLVYKKDTWQRTRLDIGNSYLSGGNLLPYLDNEGNRIVGNLNGSGGKAAVGDPPSILTFDEFPTLDFTTFLRV